MGKWNKRRMGAMLTAVLGLQFPLFASAQAAPADTTWLLRVEGTHFFVDDEYFGSRIEGYTLPGFRLEPKAEWRIGPGVVLQGGVHWLHYWGAHAYPNTASYGVLPDHSDTATAAHVLPWLQARLRATPSLTLTFGSLDPTGHQLPLPLYDPERLLAADPEQGLMAQLCSRWAEGDVWVDWREFIWNRSPRQERFTFGASGRLKLPLPEGELYLPLHFLAQHVGGQVLAVTTPIQNNFNAAAGVGACFPLLDGRMQMDLSCRAAWYHQHGNAAVPFTMGWGLYPEVRVALAGHWQMEAAYWTGHGFVPLLGSWLFSNLSSVQGGHVYDRTSLVALRAAYRLQPRDAHCRLEVGAAAYRYPLERQTQLAFHCTFHFNPTLRLR